MKQGQASSSGMGSTKVEPHGKSHSAAHVAEIGIIELRTEPAPAGVAIGGRAPPMSCTVHESGSQGKHK